MTYREYKYLVYSDLHRVTGTVKTSDLVWCALIGRETVKYNFRMRACAYTRNRTWLKYSIYPLARFMFGRMTHTFGIQIPAETKIGSGFYIGQFGEIVVSVHSVIGKYCSISQGVTLGEASRGADQGYPTLGDIVYIGPGAKIIGTVTIRDGVAIGANCFLTKDIPEDSVVGGIPGTVISREGSTGYINRTDHDKKLY